MKPPTASTATWALCALVLLSPARGDWIVSPPDAKAHALFEVGVKLGIVEHGAKEGAKPRKLVEHLKDARAMASKVDGFRLAELDGLIEALSEAEDSRDVEQLFIDSASRH